jgi:Meckel syndrome type 1 protein
MPAADSSYEGPSLKLVDRDPGIDAVEIVPRVVVFSRPDAPSSRTLGHPDVSVEAPHPPESPPVSPVLTTPVNDVPVEVFSPVRTPDQLTSSVTPEALAAAVRTITGPTEELSLPGTQTHPEITPVGEDVTSARPIAGVTSARPGSQMSDGEPDDLPLEARGEAGPIDEVSSTPRTYAQHAEATAAINHAAAAARPLTPMHAVSREVTMWLHQPMLAQIARGIEMAAEQPGQAVHVRLYPEGLGAINLEVGMAGSDVHVHIAVDNPGTRDLIQSNWSGLVQTLSDQGLSIAGAHVELSGGDGRWSGDGEQYAGWRPPGPQTRASAAADDQPAATTWANRSSASGVDYRV